MDQLARMAALEQFRKNEVTLLVASDVAARGLDIPDVSHVFNFDVPHHPDDYVHRIGRTGRAGRSGAAITIVAPADTKAVALIEKLIGQAIPYAGAPAATEEPAPAPAARHPHRRAKRSGAERGDKKAPPPPEHNKKVARIDDARPQRAPSRGRDDARGRDDEGDAGHLPAFLLRPVRLKA